MFFYHLRHLNSLYDRRLLFSNYLNHRFHYTILVLSKKQKNQSIFLVEKYFFLVSKKKSLLYLEDTSRWNPLIKLGKIIIHQTILISLPFRITNVREFGNRIWWISIQLVCFFDLTLNNYQISVIIFREKENCRIKPVLIKRHQIFSCHRINHPVGREKIEWECLKKNEDNFGNLDQWNLGIRDSSSPNSQSS